MSNRPKVTQSRIRTAAALKADARLLSGDPSRVARAAIDDDSAPAEDIGTVGELWLYGIVGGWWRGFDAESVANALRGLDVDTLYVRIHSPGGHASDGVAISNLLRNHRARVIVVVDGLAASAASVIAIAGDEVVMCPGSQMMLHDASTYAWGNEADIRRVADWIGKQSDNYAGVYAHKAGGTAAQWRQDVMLANDGDGTWYTAEEAVTVKLADEVGTRVATSSPPVAPEDEFDDDDDDFLARVEHDLRILEQHVHPAALAAWQSDPTKPARKSAPKSPSASAVGSIETEGGTAVAFSDEQLTNLRTKLGLPETADEAAITAAVEAVVEESLEERPTTTSAGDGDVVIPEVRLKDLESAAATGVAAAKKLHAMERDAFLDEHKSKYPATSRADWSARFDKDPEGTRELLTAASALVPTGEFGHESDGIDREDGASASLATVREDPAYKNWEI